MAWIFFNVLYAFSMPFRFGIDAHVRSLIWRKSSSLYQAVISSALDFKTYVSDR